MCGVWLLLYDVLDCHKQCLQGSELPWKNIYLFEIRQSVKVTHPLEGVRSCAKHVDKAAAGFSLAYKLGLRHHVVEVAFSTEC